jgi:alpha-D-ribose 1-methylphosphonate 5-triphosphate synthase subunit PhnI
MAYVAVKGGTKAIEESIKSLKYERIRHGKTIEVKKLKTGMRGLIDQIMSESSLYSEELAAIAIKQSEGSPEEAVFLLRAYRSTLPRNHFSRIVDAEEMNVERRISASFKDIPEGQILGASYDYTHRLLDFDLIEESDSEIEAWIKDYKKEMIEKDTFSRIKKIPKVIDYLRKEGLIQDYPMQDKEPIDITKKNIGFPTERSERLQILTRGQTGAVTSLGYAALRAYGALHPTVGELRVGKVPIHIDNPSSKDKNEEDSYYIGDVKVTEVESFIPKTVQSSQGKKTLEFVVGYGICFGQNETKAIAMSILDQCLETKDEKFPTHDEEFVLLHIDSVESSGFISHLKLPHYVTFQSKLDSARKTRRDNLE